MKKLTISSLVSLLMLICSTLIAQSSGIDRYYEEYKQDDHFTTITVSSKMFSLFVNFEIDDPAEKGIVNTISKLKGLKMLIGKELENAKYTYKDVVAKPNVDMEELLAVKESDKEFRFFITESEGKITELLMVGYEELQVLMISIVGDINLKEIAALSKKMDIEGFEHIKNVDQK